MQAHIKTHHIKPSLPSSEEKDYITAEEAIEQICEDLNLPIWAIYLSGFRYRENLTQKQLGELIGISPKNISNMERGRRPIGKNIAKKLATVFSTDYRKFL